MEIGQRQLERGVFYLLMASLVLTAAMGFVVENMQTLKSMIVCASASLPTQVCVGLIR